MLVRYVMLFKNDDKCIYLELVLEPLVLGLQLLQRVLCVHHVLVVNIVSVLLVPCRF